MRHSNAALIYIGTIAILATAVASHSWIDCLDTDRSVVFDQARDYIYGGDSGNGLCAGYVNNYPGRGDSAIDAKMTHKILMHEAENDDVEICMEDPNYSDWRTRLQVMPEEKFYFGYMPNGHVVKDKGARETQYGVYWTAEPETKLVKTSDLTEEKLLDGNLHDFDDGVCGESEDRDGKESGRAGNGYPCVGSNVIPKGTKPGVYNLVWYWSFYDKQHGKEVLTSTGRFGGAAYYSCFQIEVVDAKPADFEECKCRSLRDIDPEIEMPMNRDGSIIYEREPVGFGSSNGSSHSHDSVDKVEVGDSMELDEITCDPFGTPDEAYSPVDTQEKDSIPPLTSRDTHNVTSPRLPPKDLATEFNSTSTVFLPNSSAPLVTPFLRTSS